MSFDDFQGLQEELHLYRGRRKSQLRRGFGPWSKVERLQGVRVVLFGYIRITSPNFQIKRKGAACL